MKRTLLTALTISAGVHMALAQTKTVTVDANDALNNNTKIVAQTSVGQSFFTGHQIGTGYYYGAGIFRAITDNNNNAANYYYDGITNGTTNFSVRADGQGYFAATIGIGVSAPAARLHIFNQYDANQTTALKMFYQGTWNTPAYASNFRFIDLSSTENGKVLQVNGTGVGIGYDPPAWSSSDKLYISGNVGIGTNTPKEALSVNGNIRAKQIKVEITNWPDYVFKPTYQLPSLTEVKTYIDQNQHLPEIPSEQEIAKDGQNIGEMNKLLLKKVEELTLYLIEQNKRIEKLELQINKSHE
ncbi:hypothetical protein [Mucilaginibacter rubeus]|uniref:Uncharacterized protein n=1 Tax=Mucilaginibacter rubeus TaxID=2027860 RepID=A0A5C1HU63_9SPHI|nr:hypothetical protein [Mucilaginibacter rubeus]QEM09109.1 hypothetical protein DEO27_003450 [Mucilaginibacter rubeus]